SAPFAVTAFFLLGDFSTDHDSSDGLVLSRKMNYTHYRRCQKCRRKQKSAQTLRAVEASVVEIKQLLQDVHGLVTGHGRPRLTNVLSTGTSSDAAELEDICLPADAGISSAPAAINRAVTTQLAGARRRVLEHTNLDLVEIGLLDESSADQLIRLFYRHRDRDLLLHNLSVSEPSKELRKVSPFLHAVSCLHGMPYASEDWPAINIRREVYKQVRSTLGQALISSPLPLDEINAILLMSVYRNESPSYADSPVDYIDSWLLTGYCAQQAMLSISFSAVVDDVKRHMVTDADRQAIRLWANICLHHLHWAATIGRPSTIPSRYLDQCSLLLKVTEGTVREAMIVAEITLYTNLNRKLTQHSYLDHEGECREFVSWKEKWFHLFARPRSTTFRLSYHCAYFILAVRSLEDFNSGRAAEDFLGPAAIINDGHGEPAEVAALSHSDDQLRHQSYALRFAFHILETFLEMSVGLRNEMPVYLHMCVSYSALVVAQYWRDQHLGDVSAATVLEYLNDVEDWCAATPSSMIVTAYATSLAKRRVKACTRSKDGEHETPNYAHSGFGLLGNPEGEAAPGSPIYSAAEGLLGLGGIPPAAEHDGGRPPNHAMGHMADGPMPDVMLTPCFPSMEDFFAGGFLDFIK
ncbi:hypothetical protein DL546_009634, partial [Coniochaeta pulveracea]